MRRTHIVFSAAALLTVAGNAVRGQSQSQTPVPPPPPNVAVAPVPGHWAGSFKPTMVTNSTVKGAGIIRATGNADVTPVVGGRDGAFKVEIRFAMQNKSQAMTLYWAVVAGRCGTVIAPINPPSENPSLELQANGGADMVGEALLNLRAGSGYHLNIYSSATGTGDESVLSCAELKYIPK